MADVTTIKAPNPGPFTLDGTRTYVLGDALVIDPGPDLPSHIEAVLAAAPRLRAIFITHGHADHTPATAALKRKTGARVYAPPGVLAGVADEELRDGSRWDRLEAIATPGHTPEHFCFLTTDGDLFSGDAILGEGTTIVQGHMRAYIESLRKLRTRSPRRIFPGHGRVREDALAWIDHYIAHRFERQSQVLEALRRGARTVEQMRQRIYPDLDHQLHPAAELQIRAHLEYLSEQGLLPE